MTYKNKKTMNESKIAPSMPILQLLQVQGK